jgi:non-ribosomal peptide synthetase component F
LFEAQAAKTPERTSLVCGRDRLTYAELNTRANQMAHYLRQLGVQAEDRVALCLTRSTEMIIAVLAILKAGGAYVPLDPAYPKERLAYTLQDSGAEILLTEAGLASLLPQTSARVVLVDQDHEKIQGSEATNLARGASANSLAYVIYTSTDRPAEGVAIEHESTVTFLHWARSVFNEEELSGVLLATSLCFDLSVFELFAPLSVGGKIILMRMLALATEPTDEITLINTVPSAMTELVRLQRFRLP